VRSLMLLRLRPATVSTDRVARVAGEASPPRCPVCLTSGDTEVYLEQDTDVLTSDAVIGSSRTVVAPGRILRCRRCGLGFRQSRPSQEYLAELYRSVDNQVYESEELARTRSANRYFRIVQRYAPNARSILDIGCASGRFLRCARENQWSIVGVEPSDTLARKARELLGQQAQVHSTTLEEAPLDGQYFDVVTMWDVLEHIPDPNTFLRHAASFLKPGGLLFAKVPDLDSFYARVFRSKWPLLLPEHLNYFNPRSLQICGSQAGLQWTAGVRTPVAFSVGYIFYRLQQHRVPGAGVAHTFCKSTGLDNVIVPIRIGEVCAVWQR
jgi:SAM-dependent methyltransferase